MKTYNIEGAAEFLHVSTDTMKDLAGNGAVPGAKIGKAWVFNEEDLIDFVREEIKRQTAERRGIPPEEKIKRVMTANQAATRGRRPHKTPPALTPIPL